MRRRGVLVIGAVAAFSSAMSGLAAAQPQLQPRSEPVSRDQCVAAFEEGQGFERRGKLMNAGAVAYYFLERPNATSAASVLRPARLPFRATAAGLSFSF